MLNVFKLAHSNVPIATIIITPVKAANGTFSIIGAPNKIIANIVSDATIAEKDSNQILYFTKEIKNMTESDKVKIIESLWKIIYSDNTADIYEANLMTRLAGLLYIDAKTMGDVKEKIKKGSTE